MPPSVACARKVGRARSLTPYLFCAPFGILFLLFVLVPVGYAMYFSMHALHRTGLGLAPPTQVFVGLANYAQAISDPAFYHSLTRVLLFGVVQVPFMLVAALALALLLDRPVVWLRGFFRTVYFLPYAVPAVVAAILWSFLYVPSLSPFVQLFQDAGLGRPDVLSPELVLWAIANIVTWEWTGYNMVILAAALQGIPTELYDAARVDGASQAAIARWIKIPLLSPALVLTAIFSIIGTLQLFNEPEILTASTANITSSYTPNLYINTLAFTEQNPYYAAAIAVVLAMVTFALSFGVLRLVRRYSGV